MGETVYHAALFGSSPHTWGIPSRTHPLKWRPRFIPTYVGHTRRSRPGPGRWSVHPHIRGAYGADAQQELQRPRFIPTYVGHTPCIPPGWRPQSGSSPHTWGIHWIAVRKMAGFSHFSYDFTQKSYFVQGLVFFGVIGAEAFPTHRRGRNQCLPGAHGGSIRNL